MEFSWLRLASMETIVVLFFFRFCCFSDILQKADEITPFHNVTSLAIKKNETNAAAPTFQLMIGKQGNQQTEVSFKNLYLYFYIFYA